MKRLTKDDAIRWFKALAVTPSILAALALVLLGLWQWEGYGLDSWQFRGAVNLAALSLVLENVLFAAWVRSSFEEKHTQATTQPEIPSRFARGETPHKPSAEVPQLPPPTGALLGIPSEASGQHSFGELKEPSSK